MTPEITPEPIAEPETDAPTSWIDWLTEPQLEEVRELQRRVKRNPNRATRRDVGKRVLRLQKRAKRQGAPPEVMSVTRYVEDLPAAASALP